MAEAVTLEEAARFLRVEGAGERARLAALIPAGLEHVAALWGQVPQAQSPAAVRLACLYAIAAAWAGEAPDPGQISAWLAPLRAVRTGGRAA